jgi:F-type H+-transporting ATPase subunit a
MLRNQRISTCEIAMFWVRTTGKFLIDVLLGVVVIRIVIVSVIALLCFFGFEASSFASGGIVNWYDEIYRGVSGEGYNHHFAESVVTIGGGLFTLLVTASAGLLYRGAVERARDDVTPTGRFDLRTVVDMVMELVHGIAKENLHDKYLTFLPLLAGIFIFIVVSNLGGLIPGFVPATESLNTNLAMGIMIFGIYNFAGFKEHGVHYLNQFAGPMLAIAPLMFTIELISHLFRPISLSLRLMGNIFADHLMLGIFTSTPPHILIPSALMFFGLLVSLVQSFVFTLLTSIYISLAVSHDH